MISVMILYNPCLYIPCKCMILVSVVSPSFLPFLLTTGLKDVHRQQKLTTDFFKLFELTILVVNISISKKKEYPYRGFQGVIF